MRTRRGGTGYAWLRVAQISGCIFDFGHVIARGIVMTDESKRRIDELAEALAVNKSNPPALEMYYRAFPNILRREWGKAEKERSPKNGEIVRDKFPQAFKEYLAGRASDSDGTPSRPNPIAGA